MTGQIDLYGIFIPSLAMLALCTYIAFRAVVFLLTRGGFYRLVWHRALFDLTLYLTLLGIVSIAINWLQI